MAQFNTPKTEHITFSNLYAGEFVSAKEVATYPFAETLGRPVPAYNMQRAVPGGMTIYFRPTLPVSGNGGSALNQSAWALYNYFAQGFTASLPSVADAPDLEMYQAAVSNLYMLLEEGRRAYRYVKKYSTYNQYLGKRLLAQLGWNWENLAGNLANFRAEFNIRAEKLNNTLHIGPEYNLLTRWGMLVQKVWADTTVEKFQTYSFVPECYLKFGNTDLNTGSCLKWVGNRLPVPDPVTGENTNLFTTSTFFALFDELFEALTDTSTLEQHPELLPEH